MRFTNPDSLSPFGAGGVNPYAYCGGDPINNADPSGHIGTWGWVSIGIGAIGLGLALFSGGISIAAAGGIISAIDAASTSTLVIGGLCVTADITAIASGLTEDSNPEISAALGWASLGIGTAGLIAGLGKAGMQYSRAASRLQSPVVMGGTMKNLDSLGQDIYLFDDVYKSGPRLNIVAHGALQSDGTALLSRGAAAGDMTAIELYGILNKRIELSKYANIRTIMCHSGSGGGGSFGQKLATITSLPVKSYRGTVTGNFEVNSLNKLLLEAAMKHGDAGLDYMKNIFEQKHVFRIDKTNPYSLLSLERHKWHFEPVKFYP